MSIQRRLEEQLSNRRNNNLYRKRFAHEGAQQPLIKVNGKDYLNFCSNDYLGLANNQEIKKRFIQSIDKYGTGSGASHLVIGHHAEHQALESELAEFLGTERALVFSSGYAANMGVLNTLLTKGDAVFQDKLNHASLLDGGLSSGARFQRYLHKDCDSLKTKLSKHQGDALVVSDAVFSMDGDMAPIAELFKVAKAHGAWLMLDDAHGFGVLGKEGRGSVSHCGVEAKALDVYMATFGKAIGTSGAFVAGSDLLIESLVQFCRHYIYTTAMPPAVAAATRCALSIVQNETWRREKLTSLIERFRRGANQIGLSLMSSETAIQPIMLGEAKLAMEVSESLKTHNILVTAIRPPTVANGSARLRVTLSSMHTEQDVDQLLSALDASVENKISVQNSTKL